MITPHFGAGAEIGENWRAGEGNYSGVNYRPMFYDFNGIWQPIKTKRFVPEVQAGIGGVRVGFSANQTLLRSDPLVGCQTVLGFLGSGNLQPFSRRILPSPRESMQLRISSSAPPVDASHYVDNFSSVRQ